MTWYDQVSLKGSQILEHFDPLEDVCPVQILSLNNHQVGIRLGIGKHPFDIPTTALQSYSETSPFGMDKLAMAKRIVQGEPIERISEALQTPTEALRDYLYSQADDNYISNLIHRSLPYVFTLWGTNAAGQSWSGSGFIFNDLGQVLTCAHVVSPPGLDLEGVVIHAHNDHREGIVSIVEVASHVDAAILELDNISDGYLPLSTADNYIPGEEIVALGSPEGIEAVATVGYISTDLREFDNSPTLFIDVGIYPGSSGGPVLDATDSSVIGIAQGSVGEASGIGVNYVVPSSAIRPWLEDEGIPF